MGMNACGVTGSTPLRPTQRVRVWLTMDLSATRSMPSAIPVPGLRFIPQRTPRIRAIGAHGDMVRLEMLAEFALTTTLTSRAISSRVRTALGRHGSVRQSRVSVLCNDTYVTTHTVSTPSRVEAAAERVAQEAEELARRAEVSATEPTGRDEPPDEVAVALPPPSEPAPGMSTGAKVGIVVGGVVLAALAIRLVMR